jgi:hypothetical protein
LDAVKAKTQHPDKDNINSCWLRGQNSSLQQGLENEIGYLILSHVIETFAQ